MKKIAVYGTLRLTGYNHQRLSNLHEESKYEYLGSSLLKGWNMYSLGNYPTIVRGSRSIYVDLFEVSDDVFESIEGMEKGAGYDSTIVDIGGVKYTLYYQNGNFNSKKLIESGDWIKYKENRNER